MCTIGYRTFFYASESMGRIFFAVLAALITVSVRGRADGLVLTPFRGWRSWQLFGLSVTQDIMEGIMDAMVARTWTVNGVPTSLADLGYTDVGLDDGWQLDNSGPGGHGYHNASGWPIVNTTRFPSLAAMTAHAHALNLTAGWYANNCHDSEGTAGTAAPLSRYVSDAAALRAYGFDGTKLDSCGAEKNMQLWSDLLPGTVLENCKNAPWFPEPGYKPGAGVYGAEPWCPMHFYRVSVDAQVLYAALMGVNLQALHPWGARNLSFPGCWAYFDMAEVGVPPGLHPGEVALTHAEARAHFASLAVLSSPLVLGLDVRDAAAVAAVWDVIANTELLAVNAAWAGSAGTQVARAAANVTWAPCGEIKSCSAGEWEVYAKPLPGGGAAVLVLNHADAGKHATVSLPLAAVPGLACGAAGCKVRDIYAHADAGIVTDTFVVTSLPAHDSAFVTLMPA